MILLRNGTTQFFFDGFNKYLLRNCCLSPHVLFLYNIAKWTNWKADSSENICAFNANIIRASCRFVRMDAIWIYIYIYIYIRSRFLGQARVVMVEWVWILLICGDFELNCIYMNRLLIFLLSTWKWGKHNNATCWWTH